MTRNYLKLGASTLAMVIGATAAASAQNTSASTEQVVVTGSRVITNGNDSPIPLTVVSAAEITATAGDAL